MRKLLKWLGYGAAAVASILLIGSGWVWYASASAIGSHHEATPESLAEPTQEELADAPRQALILGCFSCHGEGLRGEVMLDIPNVLKLWSPNLAELAPRVGDQQLAAAIRQGIGADGRGLIAMPSPQYSRLSDGEVAALIAVIRAQPPGGAPTPPASLRPFGRFGLAFGTIETGPRLMEQFRVRQPYDLGPEHEAGRRIAAVACAECHGPDLTGDGPGGGGGAPGLSIAGAYDLDEFRNLLRTGRPPDGRDLGLMAEVARLNFSHFTDEEIARLHAYLAARAERVPQ